MRAKAVLLLLLALLFLVPVAQAIDVEPQPTVEVVIQGELTHIADHDLRVLLQAFAIGLPQALVGRVGFYDSNVEGIIDPDEPGIPPASHASLTGTVPRVNQAVLSGVVERSTDPGFVEASVSITADGSSGKISLTITRVDGLSQTFQGIGLVKITGVCLTQDCPEPQPTFAVAVQGKLSQVGDPETTVLLEAFALVFSDSLGGHGGSLTLPDHPGFGLTEAPEGVSFFEFLFFEHLTETVAVLKGSVNRSLDPALLRTPVSITADSSTGGIVFVFGPIPAGRLVGQTFTFTGTGNVFIRCLLGC